MKLMETLGNWVYDCGGEELQVEKSGENSYREPRIFLSCRGDDDDDDDDFVCRLLKALFAYCNFVVISRRNEGYRKCSHESVSNCLMQCVPSDKPVEL
jgi:hypothetical protein